MGNKKNHADDFVSEEDEPTVELEVEDLEAAQHAQQTNDQDATASTATVETIAGNESQRLETDLASRDKTIDRLQFDIEKLHAKWLGLEAEIKAREEQTVQLNQQLIDQKGAIDRQEKRVESRNAKIESLKLEIRQRDEEHQSWLAEFGNFEQVLNEAEKRLADASAERAAADELRQNFDRSEEIANELKAQTVQLNQDLEHLRSAVAQKDDTIIANEERILSLQSGLDLATVDNQTMRSALDDLQGEFAEAQTRIAEATVERAEAADVLLKLKTADEAVETLQTQNALQDKTLAEQNGVIARKEEMIERRDDKIRALESRVEQADSSIESLEIEFSDFRESVQDVEKTAAQALANRADADDLRIKLDRLNEYADRVRHQYEDNIQSYERMEREYAGLEDSLSTAALETGELVANLRAAEQRTGDLQSRIDSLDQEHEAAIQSLQLEHDQRMKPLAEIEKVNHELTSDLVESRGHNEFLKQAMNEAEEKANEQIESLREDIESLSRNAENFEQKLTSKSEKITALLAELANKSAQLESIEKIEGVIQDIDDRMSERISDDTIVDREPVAQSAHGKRPVGLDKVTRVLVGTVDGQVLQFPLFKNRLEIGRADDNDIQVAANYVSRQHAIINTDDESTRIIDWGSKNGIFVNAKRVKECSLNHGDTVTIGDAQFRYEERKKRDS